MPILILSELVSSQIAAGEVVDRPASVVKELIENSIDARATSITVRVENAGKSFIFVEDNGDGISGGDIHLALARHATSKIINTEDLESVKSLGFRGEALASIASVSHLHLSSRSKSEPVGSTLSCIGGTLSAVEKSSMTQGTSVKVERLFFNVPARMKFLKRDLTEINLINGIVQRYATEYPFIRFQYFLDGKEIVSTTGKGDMLEGVTHLFGFVMGTRMLHFNSVNDECSIRGFISPHDLTKSNRKGIIFFVNGRWIQDAGLSSAFLQAYHSMLMVGRYPFCFLSIHVPPEEIDVNVHPAKAEIRMKNPERILSLVHREVKRQVSQILPVMPAMNSSWYAGVENLSGQKELLIPEPEKNVKNPLDDRRPALPSIFEKPSSHLPILRVIGQIGLVYIVAEGPDGIYLIDQHAAHERILFERLGQAESMALPSQRLLENLIIDLPEDKFNALDDILEKLRAFGFDIDHFGRTAFMVRAIPLPLEHTDIKGFLLSILTDTDEESNLLNLTRRNLLVARICKKLAIKAGQFLTVDEQRKLIEELESCENPRTCPHGRNTMILLSADSLERQFGRRGSV